MYAEQNDSAPVYYSITGKDELTQISGGWDTFAMENKGPALIASAVQHRSIWDFISGKVKVANSVCGQCSTRLMGLVKRPQPLQG